MTDPTSVPVVDAHHHLWDLAVREQPWTADLPPLRRSFALAELEPQLTVAGVDHTVVVQTIPDAEETPELLALAESSAVVAGVVGWTDLESDAVAERLAELREAAGGEYLVGVRHGVQSEPDPGWLVRPQVLRGISAVGEADLVYDLLVTAGQLAVTIDAVRALPDVRFVLDHGGKPPIAEGGLDPWREQIDALAGEANVAVKLSGLLTEAAPDWTPDDVRPFAAHLLDCFGPDRTMFGSDWPVSTLRASYAETIDVARDVVAALSSDERRDVFGGTAVRWYGLTTR